MKLYSLQTGLLGVNSYFLVNEQTKETILIDGGESYKSIKKAENDLGVKINALLLTHAHFDHAGNACKLQSEGVKVYIGELDAEKLSNSLNLASDFGRKFEFLTPDCTLVDGQTLSINDVNIKVFSTPGHTDGSVCYLVEDMLFTGDTLFHLSVGRTDFPTGNRTQLFNSIKKLFALDGDYKVFPGHGEFTTLDFERKNNHLVDYD